MKYYVLIIKVRRLIKAISIACSLLSQDNIGEVYALDNHHGTDCGFLHRDIGDNLLHQQSSHDSDIAINLIFKSLPEDINDAAAYTFGRRGHTMTKFRYEDTSTFGAV